MIVGYSPFPLQLRRKDANSRPSRSKVSCMVRSATSAAWRMPTSPRPSTGSPRRRSSRLLSTRSRKASSAVFSSSMRSRTS